MIGVLLDSIRLIYLWKIPILTFVLSLIAIFLTFLYQKRIRDAEKLFSAFPSLPSRLPIIGNLHLLSGNLTERVAKALQLMKTYETPMLFWFFHIPAIILGKAEDIQILNNSTQERFLFNIFRNILGDGIILAKPDKWRQLRRLMNPAFYPMMLQQYLIIFNEQAAILRDKLDEFANTGETIDLWSYLADMNLDTITENMAGYKMHIQTKGGNEFSESLVTAFKLESERINRPFLFLGPIHYVYRLLIGQKNIYEKVKKLPREIVQQKIKEFYMLKRRGSIKPDTTDGRPLKSLMDLLLRIHDEYPDFTEEQMQIELLNMIFTGSETTAVTTCFVLLYLGMFPKFQEKVHEELNSIFKDSERNVTVEDMSQLVYLEQCIKESLRYYTIVPATARMCSKNVKLNDKQTIPANTIVALGYHAVHQDPQLYPNPEEWDPEHFAPEVVQRQNKNAFIAFGSGPRACIGSKYAMMSVKTQLVHILRRYRTTTNLTLKDIALTVDIISRNQNGYPVQLWRRRETAKSR